MHVKRLQFEIAQLRQQKLLIATEAIAVTLLAVVVAVFLPTLMYQYVYAGQQLTAEPEVVKMIPVLSFTAAILFFVYATITNFSRMTRIKRLERELMMAYETDEECCGGNCNCGHDDGMMEMEEVKPVKKSSSKKSK